MYNSQMLPVKPILANAPLRMPVQLLWALTNSISSAEHAQIFNVARGLNNLLGHFGGERAAKIFNLKVWAPEWNESDLGNLLAFNAVFNVSPNVLLKSLPAGDFPGAAALLGLNQGTSPRYDIIHLVGSVEVREDDLVLNLGLDALLTPGALRDALVASKTRLLIFQITSVQAEYSKRLAQFIVGSGGPAVLCVSAEERVTVDGKSLQGTPLKRQEQQASSDPVPQVLDEYFTSLYAGLIHNEPLPRAAEQPWLETQHPNVDIDVSLFYGESGEGLLQFNLWMNELHSRLETARNVLEAKRLAGQAVNLLSSRLDQNIQDLSAVPPGVWDHESEGAVPLSEFAASLEQLERDISAPIDTTPKSGGKLAVQEPPAPRVLNANFADPSTGETLKPREPLVAGSEYDLLVDVGPRWKTRQSVAIGKIEFPTTALPPSPTGWVVNVAFISDTFQPHTVSERMWIPPAQGASIPFKNEILASSPGPIELRVRAPSFPDGDTDTVMPASGRLLLYYENNLLQAAMVRFGVVRNAEVALGKEGVLEKANSVEVDFVLNGSFQRVHELQTRQLSMAPDAKRVSYPIAVNLTLNDDGAGTHRLIVNKGKTVKPGWTTYDPDDAKTFLRDARARLIECFFERDDWGNVVQDWGKPKNGLDANNGKNRDQFYFDLVVLAREGRKLYSRLLNQLNPGENEIGWAAWENELRQELSKSSVIQATRTATVSASYVFPWALVYQHPLLDPDQSNWMPCTIIKEEWSEQGIRTGELKENCPYQDQPWHSQNVICPYGFWGLKHVIEQPPSALKPKDGKLEVADSTARQILVGKELDLAIGVTRDTALDPQGKVINAHLDVLKGIPGVMLKPQAAAEDWDNVRTMLGPAEVVYFLCHGEFDSDPKWNQGYLGIGLRDSQLKHRVYPTLLNEWATMQNPNEWVKRRPLVFINGCQTANLEPGLVMNFVTTFTGFGAGGVIGTEVSIRLPLAIEIAARVLKRILQPLPIGQAMREVRWELANKGNILGLAYTPYCMADLTIVREQ